MNELASTTHGAQQQMLMFNIPVNFHDSISYIFGAENALNKILGWTDRCTCRRRQDKDKSKCPPPL